MQMLKAMDIKHQGILHSGIDDVKNMANLLSCLCQRAVLECTSDVSLA